MKLILSILFSFLSIIFTSYSHSLPYYLSADETELDEPNCYHLHHKSQDFIQINESAIIRRPYDVLRYDLFLDWYKPLSAERKFYLDTVIKKIDTIYNADGKIIRIDTIKGTNTIYYTNTEWHGINNITLKIDSNNVDIIELDAIQLRIDSIFVNSEKLPWEAKIITDILAIPISNYNVGDTIEIKIYYTYNGNGRNGFWLYPEGFFVGFGLRGDSVIVEERLAYTMSEPELARRWMPCNDAPYDKALSSIAIRVPKGFNTASNGLIDKVSHSQDATIYYWNHKYPITTYLMLAVASKFKEHSEWYDGEKQKLELLYLAWEVDYKNTETDGSKYNVLNAFRNVPEMMHAYINYFGDYPFERYGMAVIQPFNFGGMEHQTMSTVNRLWLRGFHEAGIAHELVHQWIGNLITCATWKDIWINEGGATLGEGLWVEHLYDRGAYYYYMNQHKNRYLARSDLFDTPIYDVPIQYIFWTHVPLVYQKAGWVYLMLREALGDEEFFRILRGLFKDYQYTSIETKDFANYFIKNSKNSLVPLDIFFEQWLFKAGHPIFELESYAHSISNGYNIELYLTQIQSGTNVPSAFVCPVELNFYFGEKIQTETVVTSSRKDRFEFYFDEIPDSVKINTNKLLAVLSSTFVSVSENRLLNDITENYVIPNPIFSGNTATYSFSLKYPTNVIAEIFDVNGRKVKTLHNGYLASGAFNLNIPTDNLESGSYLLILNIGTQIKVAKFAVIK